MKRFTLIIAAGLLSLGFATANAQSDEEGAASMAELLRLIEQGQARDSREARQREAAFAQARNQQQSLLNQARAERTREENVSAQLENQFEENTQRIITARQALDERLGALKELFGVLQTVSGDTQGRFASSLTNIEFPNRSEFLVELGSKMAGASSLASIEDIERRFQGRLSRRGDGAGRQTFDAIGVIWRHRLKVFAGQVAVKFFQAVDDGRIGLQAHALAQALDKHTGNARAFIGTAGLFLDNGGEYQRLVGILQRQSLLPPGPCGGQLPVHGLAGALQELDVGGAAREMVGVRQEAALGMLPGIAEAGHDLGWVISLQRGGDDLVCPNRGQQFTEGLALDDGQ